MSVHFCQPAPVYAPPAVIVQEQYHYVVQPPVTPEVVEAAPAIVEPVFLANEPMPPSEVPFGGNWFEDTHSRVTAVIGTDFDDLTVGGIKLLAQAPGGLGLDVSASIWHENGQQLRDHLWIGDANLVYQVVNRPRWKTAVGVGVNWLGDRWGGDAGVNLTAISDFRLTHRWSLAAEGDIGTLGDAELFHTRFTIGRSIGDQENVEWATGYDHYWIGGAEINQVFTGLQVRF